MVGPPPPLPPGPPWWVPHHPYHGGPLAGPLFTKENHMTVIAADLTRMACDTLLISGPDGDPRKHHAMKVFRMNIAADQSALVGLSGATMPTKHWLSGRGLRSRPDDPYPPRDHRGLAAVPPCVPPYVHTAPTSFPWHDEGSVYNLWHEHCALLEHRFGNEHRVDMLVLAQPTPGATEGVLIQGNAYGEVHLLHEQVAAIGSGAAYALGALLSGSSPRTAAYTATLASPWCGGDVHTFTLARPEEDPVLR